jgi:hypothetical protein
VKLERRRKAIFFIFVIRSFRSSRFRVRKERTKEGRGFAVPRADDPADRDIERA